MGCLWEATRSEGLGDTGFYWFGTYGAMDGRALDKRANQSEQRKQKEDEGGDTPKTTAEDIGRRRAIAQLGKWGQDGL